MPMDAQKQAVIRIFLNDFLNYILSTKQTISRSELTAYPMLNDNISTMGQDEFFTALQAMRSITKYFDAYIAHKASAAADASWPEFGFFAAQISNPAQAKLQLQTIITQPAGDGAQQSAGSPSLATFLDKIGQFEATCVQEQELMPVAGGASSADSGAGSAAAEPTISKPLDIHTKTELKNFLTTFINWLYFNLARGSQRDLKKTILAAYHELINYLGSPEASFNDFILLRGFEQLINAHQSNGGWGGANDPFKVFIDLYLTGRNPGITPHIISSAGSKITVHNLYQLTQTSPPVVQGQGRVDSFYAIMQKLDAINTSHTQMQQCYSSFNANYILADIVLDLIDDLQIGTESTIDVAPDARAAKIQQKLKLVQKLIAEKPELGGLSADIGAALTQDWSDQNQSVAQQARDLRTKLAAQLKELAVAQSTAATAAAEAEAEAEAEEEEEEVESEAEAEAASDAAYLLRSEQLTNIEAAFQAIVSPDADQADQDSLAAATPQLAAFKYYINKIKAIMAEGTAYSHDHVNNLLTLAELNLMQPAAADAQSPTITLYIANCITLLEEFRSGIKDGSEPQYSDHELSSTELTKRLKDSPYINLPDFDNNTARVIVAVTARTEQMLASLKRYTAESPVADEVERPEDQAPAPAPDNVVYSRGGGFFGCCGCTPQPQEEALVSLASETRSTA
jgi:hypothetical protein